MFEIKIDGKDAVSALNRLAAAEHNMSTVMRAIATELHSQTEANFAAEGRPKWPSLSVSTLKAAQAKGRSPARMLQDSGQLAASITTSSGAKHASIGSNKVYAAIHQFGGMAGKGKKIAIPARPFLPVTASRDLQREAVDPVIGLLKRYLLKSLKP